MTLQRRSGSGPSAKFLAAAEKRLVIGVRGLAFLNLSSSHFDPQRRFLGLFFSLPLNIRQRTRGLSGSTTTRAPSLPCGSSLRAHDGMQRSPLARIAARFFPVRQLRLPPNLYSPFSLTIFLRSFTPDSTIATSAAFALFASHQTTPALNNFLRVSRKRRTCVALRRAARAVYRYPTGGEHGRSQGEPGAMNAPPTKMQCPKRAWPTSKAIKSKLHTPAENLSNNALSWCRCGAALRVTAGRYLPKSFRCAARDNFSLRRLG